MSHVRRFDHVGLTVADLDVVTAFFVALGLLVWLYLAQTAVTVRTRELLPPGEG